MSEQVVVSRWRRWAAEVPSIAFLAAAVTFLFSHAIFTTGTFYLRDQLFTYRPYQAVIARMVRDGVMPLWNPHVYFGQPLHAVLMEVVYPTTLFHYFLSFESAFKAHVILHFYLAAFGMYALGRALSLSRIAACGAALSYALGSFMTSDGAYFNSLTTAGWAPWVILALVACARRPSILRLVLAAAPLALAMIGGEVETLFFAIALAFLIALAEAEGPLSRRLARVSLPFTLVGAAGVALAMVQVLPTMEMIAQSPRGAGLAEFERTHFSLAALTSLELLVPKVLGNPAGDFYYMGGRSWGGGGEPQVPYFYSIYIGLAPFCLWACGAILGRGRTPRVVGVLALLALLLMAGNATPLYGALVEVVPFLKAFRFPVKFFTLVSLAGALLAGYGVEALLEASWSSASVARRRVWGAALAVVLGGAAVGAWALLVGKEAIPYLFSRAKEGGHLAASVTIEQATPVFEEALRSIGVTVALHVAMLLAAVWALSGRHARVAAFALVALLGVDLTRANLDMLRVSDPESVAAAPGVLENLPPNVQDYRITTRVNDREYKYPENLRISGGSVLRLHQLMRLGLYPSTAAAYGFRYGNLFDYGSIYPRVLGEVLVELRGRPESDWVSHYQRTGIRFVICLQESTDPRMKLVRTVPSFASHPFLVYEVADPLPRAILVPSARGIADPALRRKAWVSAGFDPRAEVLLEGDRKVTTAGGPIEQRVEVEEGKDPGRVLVRVDAERDAWLLLIDSWSPGWKATVDGRPVEIERADLLFRAVRVPAGRHEVLFRYEPWTFKAGLVVSLGAAALCGLLLLVPVVLRRPAVLPTAPVESLVERFAWPLALAGAVTWFHWALFPPSTTLFKGDHSYTYRPYQWEISGIWGQGEVPLWNPGVFFGQPLLATLSLVIYPTALFYAFLPFDTAYDFHFLAHAYVAAFSMYALGRRLGWEPWIALISAATWALGGYVVSAGQFYNVIVTAAWAPAVIWAIDRVVERPRARAIGVAGIAACLQLLGGEVLTIGFTYVVGLVVWLRHVPAERRAAWAGRLVAALSACIALAALLAAFQVLPTAELVSRSPRAGGLSEPERMGFSMSWATAAEIAFPRVLGDPVNDAYYQGNALWGTASDRRPPYLLSRYVGVVLLILAVFGGVVVRGWRPKALAFLVVFGLVQMFGKNLPSALRAFDWLPLVRGPIKFFALASLAQALLVGEALSFLSTGAWRDLGAARRWILFAGGAACLLVLGAGGALSIGAESYASRVRDWLVTQEAIKLDLGGSLEMATEVLRGGAREAGRQSVLGAIVLVALALALFRPSSRGWAAHLLVVAVLADLAFANRPVNPVAPIGDMSLRPAALDLPGVGSERIHTASVDSLDIMPVDLRVTSENPRDLLPGYRFHQAILSPHMGLRHGVRYGVPFDPGRFYPRELALVADRWREKGSGPRTRFLRRSGLRYTFSLVEPVSPKGETVSAYVERGHAESFSNKPLRLYEVSEVLPRAYVVPGEVQEADLEKAVDLWLSKDFDPTEAAIVEGTPAPAGGTGTGRIVSERTREVVVEADAPQGGTLVLLDSYAPGWVAEVDGKETPVVRANALFRGVQLPPGRHTVRFRYEPTSFRVGASISVVALLLTIGLLAWRRRAPSEAR